MMENYIDYINKFKRLDIDDKRKEIVNNFNELFNVLYTYNNKFDISKDLLPIFRRYNNEDEFLDLLFTYIISFKEENAKLIKYLIKNRDWFLYNT